MKNDKGTYGYMHLSISKMSVHTHTGHILPRKWLTCFLGDGVYLSRVFFSFLRIGFSSLVLAKRGRMMMVIVVVMMVMLVIMMVIVMVIMMIMMKAKIKIMFMCQALF